MKGKGKSQDFLSKCSRSRCKEAGRPGKISGEWASVRQTPQGTADLNLHLASALTAQSASFSSGGLVLTMRGPPRAELFESLGYLCHPLDDLGIALTTG